MSTNKPAYRVFVFEVNEISWKIMRPWLERGELRNFERLRRKGGLGSHGGG